MPLRLNPHERSAIQVEIGGYSKTKKIQLVFDLKVRNDNESSVFFTAAARKMGKIYIVNTWEDINKSFQSKDLTVWNIGCLPVALQTNSDCLKPSVF